MNTCNKSWKKLTQKLIDNMSCSGHNRETEKAEHLWNTTTFAHGKDAEEAAKDYYKNFPEEVKKLNMTTEEWDQIYPMQTEDELWEEVIKYLYSWYSTKTNWVMDDGIVELKKRYEISLK